MGKYSFSVILAFSLISIFSLDLMPCLFSVFICQPADLNIYNFPLVFFPSAALSLHDHLFSLGRSSSLPSLSPVRSAAIQWGEGDQGGMGED